MKKALILLLLFIVACGGSSEETVVKDTTTTTIQDTTTTTIQDTTTTTIPPAPTVDFNIVEIYNTKLGTDLCSDASDIDATPEPCLKKYRDNLELVLSYEESLQKYITELNNYLEAYPSAMTEEYTTLFQFVNNEYQAVPETYGIVANKYIDRFGGVPTILTMSFNNELWNDCPANIEFTSSENLKQGTVKYKNNIGEQISFELKGEIHTEKNILKVLGGEFNFDSATLKNYLGEEYSVSKIPINSFTVNHWDAYFTKIQILNYDEENLTVQVEWKDGFLKLEAFALVFIRDGLYEDNGTIVGVTNQGLDVANKRGRESFLEEAFSKEYIERSESKIIMKWNFKKNNNFELLDIPLELRNVYSVDPYFENFDLQYRYNNYDSSFQFIRRVGCSGQSSVKKITDENISQSDPRYIIPFKSFENNFLVKP